MIGNSLSFLINIFFSVYLKNKYLSRKKELYRKVIIEYRALLLKREL